ncbi:M14 metallopeptidase family protein [Chryseolinea sp. T2]|uniref:M14 metallopeptidase family protein n=1 Tax=Chryseolinea sp. T2 TaxID=3129255 RepID=UPI00307761B6
MRRTLFSIFILISAVQVFAQELQSPEKFLGYKLGDKFTRHHRVVEYFRYVADALPNVEVVQYGQTYEGRPLIYTIISSPENFNNREEIRLNNLRRAGLSEGTPTADKKPVVWLSYNVHGNEASSLEASMLTLYELANPSNTKTQAWLKDVVVIMDPCINPDGRDRYANFYNQFGNVVPNSSGTAKEHREPWPGGRSNHYMFDLNRDWAWQTQVESQQRLKVYNQWMPQVHVDFHEQAPNNPYYFAPAAEPYHDVISNWQREFQKMIGRNNAKYFDEQGWLYFTKEVFDLYYPSYGDTYPTYSGAIGMTYEQAGSGYAGLSITTEEGDPLTLKDRLTHHHTTGLSTIEITALNATRVIDEYEKYFKENLNSPAATYKTYIIKGDNNPDKLASLAKWMESHSIRFGYPQAGKSSRGFDYQTQITGNVNVTTEDLVVNIYQPKSRFITTVFEPQSKLSDSLTYDITAWNLMYAYNLKAYALTERINPAKPFAPKVVDNGQVAVKPYAYLFAYQSLKDVEFLGALLKANVKVRTAAKPFIVGGVSYEAGTLIVTRRNNENLDDFDGLVKRLANEAGRKINTTMTGFVDKGYDFGSSEVKYLKAPKVAVLIGEQAYSLSAGEVWHFFEQQVHYPITQIGTDYFKTVDLKPFDVLVVPEGNYRLFDEAALEQLSTWINGGGRLIVIANAINAFAEKKNFALKNYLKDTEKADAEKKETDTREKGILNSYGDIERRQVSEAISGAIYKVSLDPTHPLSFGLGNTYYSLKTNELRFGYLEYGWNVGVIKGKAKPVQGFAGARINPRLENSLTIGVEQKGQGNVIYLIDNPLFREFWENGKMLFANAVFMVGQK